MAQINREVISTAISGVDYNEETQVLTVTFQNGKAYDYADVPAEVVQDMLRAESIGKFYHKNIVGYAETQRA